MEFVWILLLGYFIGSIPFALVIGKVFYHTDVRKQGSGNLGGGNTGRVLGSKAGLAVMTLDLLKVTFVVFLANLLSPNPWAVPLGAISGAIGHCYPIFARFKGGKAVATMYGFLFGLWVIGRQGCMVFFLPLLLFLFVLYLSKIVALSSIISAVGVTVYVLLFCKDTPVTVALGILTLMLFYRHRGNFLRIIKGTENKVKWL